MTRLAIRLRLRPSVLHFCGIALILLAGAAPAQDRAPQERDLWYAHVDGDLRYGSHHIEVTALPEGNYRYLISARVLVDLFASQKQETIGTGEYIVTADLRPVSMKVEGEQLSGSFVVAGRRSGDTFTISFDRSGTEREKVIAIDPSETVLFSISVDDWLAGIDPGTERATATVIDESGESTPVVATRVRQDAAGSEWILASGAEPGVQVLTFDGQGLMLKAFTRTSQEAIVRCTADEARDLTYRVMNGREVLVFPLDRRIDLPHRLEHLVVRLTWKDIPFADFELEDGRQRVLEQTETADGQSALVEIFAPVVSGEVAALPVEDVEFAPYLAETEYVKPADPKILAAAKEATAGTKDARKAVEALSKWVSDFVKDELIAETLTGPEVLACGKGKCTEHSTLFASMARGVGIPTRMVLGERMINGSWVGHMWNEAWIGRWITVDATNDEVDRSFQLLKFIHSETVQGTQPLRWKLTESLALSIQDFKLAESELAGMFETGIDGGTYTNVDYATRLSAPSEDWTLTDLSSPGEVTIRFAPPAEVGIAIHFVGFSVADGSDPKQFIDSRLGQIEGMFDTFEVFANERRQIRSVQGQASYFQGRNDSDKDAARTAEVCWVRGPVGYLLTMSARGPAYDSWIEDFEKLIASFRFLDE